MLKHWRRWLVVVVALLLATAGVKVWRVLDQPATPALTLEGVAVDGRPINLAQSLKTAGDKPVMVVFWATWCPDCIAEQDHIQSISRDYEVIAVAWRSEDDTNVVAHMKKHGLTYPSLNDQDGHVTASWGLKGVPNHFIVQPNGKMRFRVEGSRSEWKLRALLWWAGRFQS